MSPRVREATVADAAHIARVERAVGATFAADTATATALIAAHAAWVIEAQGGAPFGHLIGGQVLDEAEIFSIAIAPDHHRRGAGRLLHDAAASAWRDAGVARVHLEVRADNLPALALYRSCGYARCGRRAGYYRDGVDAVLMTLELD